MKKLLLVIGVLAAACASPAPPAADSPDPSTSSAPAVGGGESILPDVEVRDVATGETVNLGSLTPASRPQLLWMWAPH